MTREVKPFLIQLAARVKALRKKLGFKQKEFAEILEISSSYLSEVEAGKTKPGYDFFLHLSARFAVNFDWLLHGKGEMMAPPAIKATLAGKKIGERIETVEELLWYIENSPLFMYTIMGFATKFLYENETIIKKDTAFKRPEIEEEES